MGLRLRFCITGILVTGMILSCGYRFAGTGELPSGIRRICVTVLDNPSAETGIETIFSNDIIYELTRGGHPVSRTPSQADATLSGRIARLSIDSISRRGSQETWEERVTIVLSLKLTDAANNIIWADNGISENQTYEVVTGNKPATEVNRRLAIETLSRRMAQNVYNRLTTGF